ncbi:endoribonuclease MazF [Entomobacter blattae]|uniref:Endoribonuclease toxin MazF n=1 Tax=Entomobacter blattae TaxID=2762277 RepID=A0A7H1NTZ6_9PROT|nr:endoribonuclease MazF [Entomobacter blattae]QNT79256.1 Endoribonuclease toxin MazF [Entomobacter blattae]
MVKSYIPECGDIIWISFDPSKGHEQQKRRPALVLSPKRYNQKTNLLLCCPITSRIKGYPFEVLLDKQNAILADQVKSFDWKARNAEFKAKAPMNSIDETKEKLLTLLS